jgi:hypothetical protein
MNKIKMNVLKKTIVKDDMGFESKTYTPVGSFLCDYVLPYGEASAKKDYGFNVASTHRTFTRYEIQANDYVQDDKTKEMYHVLQCAVYPKHRVLVMEKVKA